MNYQQIPLHIKLLFGYGVIILVVGYMLSVLFHERNRMDTIEYEERKLHQIRNIGSEKPPNGKSWIQKRDGNPPLKYINQKKIEKAQLILVTDSLTVKEVTYRLAFEDYSYFNRLFKKVTGLTPQQYRYSYQ